MEYSIMYKIQNGIRWYICGIDEHGHPLHTETEEKACKFFSRDKAAGYQNMGYTAETRMSPINTDVYCWVGEHWIKSGISRHGELGWGSYCEECDSSFDVDIEDYLIPRGTKVRVRTDENDEGWIGVVDWNDEETSDEFENINYCVCPIEYTHLEHWSDHYVWLRREDFEIVENNPPKYYFADDAYIDRIYGSASPVCIDFAELKELAAGWEIPVEELLKQMHEATAEEISVYGIYNEKG